MIKKRNAVPALLLGLVLLGTGSAAYAAFGGPGELPSKVLSAFSADEQAAIQQAQEIRSSAEAEAQAVLDAAGVTEDALHTAMTSFREEQRTALNEALDNNDYDAYKALVANNPNADELTQDIFTKLVDIRELEQSGDREGAMELRQELKDSGFMGGGHGGPGRMGPPPSDK